MVGVDGFSVDVMMWNVERFDLRLFPLRLSAFLPFTLKLSIEIILSDCRA